MRKVILQEFVSLDGRAAGPNDSVDFIPASTKGDRAFGQGQMALLDTIDTILLGRVTYQMFAGYFPLVTEGDDKAFADKLNAIPKIVFSRTLTRAPWGQWDDATIVRRSPTKEVTALKQQPGKDIIVWGSLSLAQSLLAADLIDEVQLRVCPIPLGAGRRIFTEDTKNVGLHLLEAKPYTSGIVSLRYATQQP